MVALRVRFSAQAVEAEIAVIHLLANRQALAAADGAVVTAEIVQALTAQSALAAAGLDFQAAVIPVMVVAQKEQAAEGQRDMGSVLYHRVPRTTGHAAGTGSAAQEEKVRLTPKVQPVTEKRSLQLRSMRCWRGFNRAF